jgi:hypothetical protein
MRTLESRNYLATDSDVEAIARQHIEGLGAQATYLKILVAGTQAALGAEPRQRSTNPAKTFDQAAHLGALETVHDRYYTIVLRVASDAFRDSKERNRASNYARSAKSTLRAWIKSGHDVRSLAAGRVSKEALRKAIPRRAVGPPRNPAKRMLKLADRLEAIATGPDNGVREAIEAVMQRLANKLMTWGGEPVREPSRAIAEHRPLQTRAGVFWPAALQ